VGQALQGACLLGIVASDFSQGRLQHVQLKRQQLWVSGTSVTPRTGWQLWMCECTQLQDVTCTAARGQNHKLLEHSTAQWDVQLSVSTPIDHTHTLAHSRTMKMQPEHFNQRRGRQNTCIGFRVAAGAVCWLGCHNMSDVSFLTYHS
jgi:hypothetical protein